MALSYGNSWTDICNIALAAIGKARIDDLDSSGTSSLYCNTLLPTAIESVMSMSGWRCMRKRVQLARSSADPIYGYTYAYVIPTDCINLVEYSVAHEDYQVEDGLILSDVDELYAVYIPRTESPQAIPGYLKELIAYKLASLLTVPLAASDALAAKIEVKLRQAEANALGADALRAGIPSPQASYLEDR